MSIPTPLRVFSPISTLFRVVAGYALICADSLLYSIDLTVFRAIAPLFLLVRQQNKMTSIVDTTPSKHASRVPTSRYLPNRTWCSYPAMSDESSSNN